MTIHQEVKNQEGDTVAVLDKRTLHAKKPGLRRSRMDPIGIIDCVVAPRTPRSRSSPGQVGVDEHFMDKVRMPEEMRRGMPMECLRREDGPGRGRDARC